MLAPVCRVLRYEIEVTNFTSSWSDGKAFCAILHRHRPDTLDYTTQVDEARHLENLQLAFDTAYDQLGVEKLLDPEGLWCNVSYSLALTSSTYVSVRPSVVWWS